MVLQLRWHEVRLWVLQINPVDLLSIYFWSSPHQYWGLAHTISSLWSGTHWHKNYALLPNAIFVQQVKFLVWNANFYDTNRAATSHSWFARFIYQWLHIFNLMFNGIFFFDGFLLLKRLNFLSQRIVALGYFKRSIR